MNASTGTRATATPAPRRPAEDLIDASGVDRGDALGRTAAGGVGRT